MVVPAQSVGFRALTSTTTTTAVVRLADLDDDTAAEIVGAVEETRAIFGIGIGVPVLCTMIAVALTATPVPTWIAHTAVLVGIAIVGVGAATAQIMSARHLRRTLTRLGVDVRLAPAVSRTLRLHLLARRTDISAARALQNHR